MNQFIVWSFGGKNAHHCFPKDQDDDFKCVFCSTNQRYSVSNDGRLRKPLLAFEKWEHENFIFKTDDSE